MLSWSIFLLLTASVFVVYSAPLKPAKSYFDICHLSDSKYNDCVRKTLEKIRPQLIKGIPELNIVTIEPLHIEKIELSEGTGNLALKQKLLDLYIHGVSDYIIEDISINYEKKEMNYTLKFPRMEFRSNYELEGRILVLPIKGEGEATFNFTDVKTSANLKLETFKKKGNTFVRIKNYALKIEPAFVRLHFTNLFNGDKVLGETTNKFLNDNWKEAYFTYRELPEKAFAQYLKALSNNVLEKFPAEDLFPE